MMRPYKRMHQYNGNLRKYFLTTSIILLCGMFYLCVKLYHDNLSTHTQIIELRVQHSEAIVLRRFLEESLKTKMIEQQSLEEAVITSSQVKEEQLQELKYLLTTIEKMKDFSYRFQKTAEYAFYRLNYHVDRASTCQRTQQEIKNELETNGDILPAIQMLFADLKSCNDKEFEIEAINQGNQEISAQNLEQASDDFPEANNVNVENIIYQTPITEVNAINPNEKYDQPNSNQENVEADQNFIPNQSSLPQNQNNPLQPMQSNLDPSSVERIFDPNLNVQYNDQSNVQPDSKINENPQQLNDGPNLDQQNYNQNANLKFHIDLNEDKNSENFGNEFPNNNQNQNKIVEENVEEKVPQFMVQFEDTGNNQLMNQQVMNKPNEPLPNIMATNIKEIPELRNLGMETMPLKEYGNYENQNDNQGIPPENTAEFLRKDIGSYEDSKNDFGVQSTVMAENAFNQVQNNGPKFDEMIRGPEQNVNNNFQIINEAVEQFSPQVDQKFPEIKDKLEVDEKSFGIIDSDRDPIASTITETLYIFDQASQTDVSQSEILNFPKMNGISLKQENVLTDKIGINSEIQMHNLDQNSVQGMARQEGRIQYQSLSLNKDFENLNTNDKNSISLYGKSEEKQKIPSDEDLIKEWVEEETKEKPYINVGNQKENEISVEETIDNFANIGLGNDPNGRQNLDNGKIPDRSQLNLNFQMNDAEIQNNSVDKKGIDENSFNSWGNIGDSDVRQVKSEQEQAEENIINKWSNVGL